MKKPLSMLLGYLFLIYLVLKLICLLIHVSKGPALPLCYLLVGLGYQAVLTASALTASAHHPVLGLVPASSSLSLTS